MHPTPAVDHSPAGAAPPPLFTLLICTYNRAALLKRCLHELARLRVPSGLHFEIVVVDNASPDDTAEIVNTFKGQWPGLMVRLLREDRQGVAFARKSGMREAKGVWVAMVDDDCLLREGWLEEAAKFAEAHPRAGAFGGRNALEWEEAPSQLCVDYGESLARQDWGDKRQQAPATGKHCLCGAGLVLRMEAVRAAGYLENGLLRGRHPISVGAGEDTEMQLIIRNAGWELWYVPTLLLRHWIPASRMSLNYLKPLHRGFGEAESYLRLLGDSRPLTLKNRWSGVVSACVEVRQVLSRFWVCVVVKKAERPVWMIRMWFAWGFLKGSLRLLLLGRVE